MVKAVVTEKCTVFQSLLAALQDVVTICSGGKFVPNLTPSEEASLGRYLSCISS